MVLAWTSPYIVEISKDKINYHITEEEASRLSIIPPFSTVVTCLFFSKLNDRIGRKYTLMFIAVPYIVFFLLTIVATRIEIFYISRVFAGFGDSIFYISLPMYVGEITTPKVRGTWGNLQAINAYFGMFLINIIGSFVDVKTAAYYCLPLPLIFMILMLPLPESPYFHIMKDQEECAKKSLRFLRGKEDVEDEFTQLKSDVERQISETGSWKDLFKIRTNRKALCAAAFLRFSQQMSGILVFSNFAQFIFKKAGSHISSKLSSMIYSGLIFVLTVCCVYSVDKFGRKKNYTYSLLSCGVVLLLLSIFFFLDQHTGFDMKNFKWFPLVGMLTYIIFMTFGIGMIPPLMLGELFSASIKAKGLTVSCIVTGISQFLSNTLFFVLYSYLGLYASFLFFSICCFISTVFSVKLIPETKGKTLEEIQQTLRVKKNGILLEPQFLLTK